MKNYPLSVQIWIVIAIITLSISTLLSFILPSTLRTFFTDEIYATIDSAQDLVFNQFDSDVYRDFVGSDFFGNKDEMMENIRTVRHFLMYDDNRVVVNSPLPVDFIQKVKDQSLLQEDLSKEYSGKLEGEQIFYVMTKGRALNENVFLVSYMSDSYRQDLVQTLLKKLLSIMLLVFLFSWIPSIMLSRYLSKPLVNLEKRVEKLANREWSEPVDINRKDEIGKLCESIEELRTQLIRQDEAEQSFLQHISHELKTPVMVIRSFTQAISDGIYPKGDLNNSIEIIDQEAERLEKRIKNLLYLTKLDYLSNHKVDKTNFSLDSLIKDVIGRISWSRQDIDLDLNLSKVNIESDQEQWRVVLENLFDNQMRYAKNKIKVSLYKDMDKYVLHLWNNGDPIEKDVLNNIFDRFNKGYKGEFGLGLAIVYRILNIHGDKITAKNEKEGVSFYIQILI